jgi:hypothetical protein
MARFRQVVLLPFLLGACTQVPGSFVCTDEECVLGSETGTCEPTNYCSFPVPDGICASGQRYDSSAGGGLAGRCTDMSGDMGMSGGGKSLCPTFPGFACQSFEQAIASPWSYFNMSGAAISEGNGHVYRGASAGLSKAPMLNKGTQAAGQLLLQNVPMNQNSTVYLRAFLWVDTPPPADVPLIVFQQSQTPYNSHVIGLNTNGIMSTNDSVLGQSSPGMKFPMSQWVCLTLSIQVAQQGKVQVSMWDVDQPQMDLTGNTVSSPPTNEASAGIYLSGTMANTTEWALWMDELAVDTSPISCAD